MTVGKLIIVKGLPASGKTSWAKQFQEQNANVVRVNRDELRNMLHNGVFSKQNEQEVVDLEKNAARRALSEGKTVIIDDTNLVRNTFDGWVGLAEGCSAEWEVKDFTDVSWDVCVARNECRIKPVPMAAMKRMRNLLNAERETERHKYLPYDPNLPDAVICDLDGTIAIMNGRNPYDGSRCGEDLVNEPVQWVLLALLHYYVAGLNPLHILFVSGRDDEWMDMTKAWLERHGLPSRHLFMRRTMDKRDDVIVKREIYEAHIQGKYNVRLVLDDRNKVVKSWRGMGLPCFAVVEGDF